MRQWIKLLEDTQDDDPEGITPEFRDAVAQHVDLTSAFMARAKALATFDLGALARVAMSKGVGSAEALARAEIFVDHFPHLFEPLGDGMYAYQPEKKQDTMSFLRDIAARATNTGRIDPEVDTD